MVLGMISLKVSTKSVKIPETIPTPVLLNSRPACEPTSEAPAVLAMVLSIRMALSGLSILVLRDFSLDAPLAPCSSSILAKVMGVDSKVASSSEHKKEMQRANSA